MPNSVNWRLDPNKQGMPNKVPYIAGSGKKAASTDSSTWRTFESATKSLGPERGLAFMLPDSNKVAFLDLDDVRNPQTALIEPRAMKLLQMLGSTYIENSPSGTGLRIYGWLKGSPPPNGANM